MILHLRLCAYSLRQLSRLTGVVHESTQWLHSWVSDAAWSATVDYQVARRKRGE